MGTTAAPPSTLPTRDGSGRGARTRKRRWIGAGIGAALLLGLVEAALRFSRFAPAPAAGEIATYVDVHDPVPIFEQRSFAGVATWVRTSEQPLVVRDSRFTALKAPGTLRIFVVGASAAAGWPHQDEHNGYTISAMLRDKLVRLLPERNIEVINAAGSTYATHRVKLLFDEVLRHEPDLVLLYAGNNEFVEAFPFRPRLSATPWAKVALLRAFDRGLEALAGHVRPSIDIRDYGEATTTANRVALMFGQPSRYWVDPDLHRQIVERYRYNMTAMVRAARSRGVPLMITNVPVNLKEWIPNVSVHAGDLSAADRERWQAHYREGVLALEAQDLERAVAELARAAAIDDDFAEGHYDLGVALHRLGRLEEARAAYLRALERDAFPYRETPELARVLAEIARAEGLDLLDSIGLLEARARDRICGLESAIDHVHLRGGSQEAIAHGAIEEMVRRGILKPPFAVPLEATRVSVPELYDELATDIGVVSIFRALIIMRQYDKLDASYQHLVQVLRARAARDATQAQEALRQLRYAEEIYRVVGRFRKLHRAQKIGSVEQEFSEDEASAILGDYVAMVRTLEGRRLSTEEFDALIPALEYRAAAARAGGS